MLKAGTFIAGIFLFLLLQVNPRPVFACVQGLSWGMNLSRVEAHLGIALKPINRSTIDSIYEVKNFQMSGIPVKNLRIQVKDPDGLQQLAYEMDYKNMPEVLAGLRYRFGPPVGTSVDIDGQSPKQQWVWHTGDDVITAIKSEERLFLLSYRPSLLDPSFL